MGGGSWDFNTYKSYNANKGITLSSSGMAILDGLSTQEVFVNRRLDPMLNPKSVIRECRDTKEHPNTIPILICADMTGSMGQAAMEVVSKLNIIISDLYERYKDIQICVMGIGDLDFDNAPIQISQFESDIRIAEQLDKIYFEGGGGGNGCESYSAAWYYGVRHTDLDCWKRGKKGIIITTGDEPLNSRLNCYKLSAVSGDGNEADIETKDLYNAASEKFDIYHIAVDDPRTSYYYYKERINKSFGSILPSGHLKVSTMDSLAKTIVECIDDALSGGVSTNNGEGISW